MDALINLNSLIKRTAKDALIYLPSMIIPAVLGIAFLRVFTTLLSPEEYGHYNIALSTIGLIKVFSVIWLSSSAIRFHQKYKKQGEEAEFISSLFFSSGASGILLATAAYCVLIFGFRDSIQPKLFGVLQITILSSVVISVFEIIINLFRSDFKPQKYSVYWGLYVIGKPIIGVGLLLFAGMKAEGIFWGFFIAPFLLLFFIFKDLKLAEKVKIKYFSTKPIKDFMGYGIPMMFSNLSLWILTLSDRYLVELFRGSDQVGLYGLGYSIPEKTIQFTFMTLMLAAYPIIIENWEKKDGASTQQLITEMSRYYFLLITPVVTTLVAIPKQILLLLADEKFIQGARVIPFIAAGLYLLGLSQYVQKGLELKQKSIKIAATSFIAGITNILGNIFLIPKIGIIGAGISCFFSYMVYLICAVLFVRDELAWRAPMRSVRNVLAASLAMFLCQKTVTLFVTNTFVVASLSILFGFLSFIAVLFILGEIKKSEIEFLNNILGKLAKKRK